MARQQRVSNERRKELEELDPFQENLLKAIDYIKTYKKQLILIALGFAAVIVIFSVVIFNIKSSESKASLLLNETLIEYSKIKDSKEGFLAIESNFSKLFEDYSNTAAGKMAKIKFAKICYDAADYKKAYEYYKKALSDYKSDPAIESLILSSLGRTCLALDNFKEAEAYFVKITKKNDAILKDEALYNLGMIAEKTGDKTASHDFYKKIILDYPDSIYKALAQNKLE
ncbi:MAG: tetratricopeptide repeat protein [Desulfobacteraceae bacterium]|nr:tetratricopeptide repeat protein [Desulfobacteraceae bacterium]